MGDLRPVRVKCRGCDAELTYQGENLVPEAAPDVTVPPSCCSTCTPPWKGYLVWTGVTAKVLVPAT